MQRKTIFKTQHDDLRKCLFVNLKGKTFWIFPLQGQVFIHRGDRFGEPIGSMCDFSITDCENGFLWIQGGKIKIMQLCPPDKMEHYAPMLHTKLEMGSDIKKFVNYAIERKSYFFVLIANISPETDQETYEMHAFTSKSSHLHYSIYSQPFQLHYSDKGVRVRNES